MMLDATRKMEAGDGACSLPERGFRHPFEQHGRHASAFSFAESILCAEQAVLKVNSPWRRPFWARGQVLQPFRASPQPSPAGRRCCSKSARPEARAVSWVWGPPRAAPGSWGAIADESESPWPGLPRLQTAKTCWMVDKRLGQKFWIAGIAPVARVAMVAAESSRRRREMDSMMERGSDAHIELPGLGQ